MDEEDIIAFFLCAWCARVSYHPDDIANEYCSCCGSFRLPTLCTHTRHQYDRNDWDINHFTPEALDLLKFMGHAYNPWDMSCSCGENVTHPKAQWSWSIHAQTVLNEKAAELKAFEREITA